LKIRTASARGAASCAIALFLLTSLAGCATPPSSPAARAAFLANDDPLEPLNRKIFAANEVADRFVLKPVAKAYVAIVPAGGRDTVRRVLDNMKEPILFINNTLQGRFRPAGITLGRLALNTTIGLGGIFDVAKMWGLPREPADFGETLYSWGVPSGPYLVLPLLGPSNPRDAIGMGIDSYADPVTYLADAYDLQSLTIARLVADGIDRRARALGELDTLQESSLDFYAELRSLAQQSRAAQLDHGKPPAPNGSLYIDPGTGAAEPAPPARSTPLSAPPAKTAPAAKAGASADP
jgi:phospholipid-binding lipoprotein MlaA